MGKELSYNHHIHEAGCLLLQQYYSQCDDALVPKVLMFRAYYKIRDPWARRLF